jgi:VWFA-related protein
VLAVSLLAGQGNQTAKYKVNVNEVTVDVVVTDRKGGHPPVLRAQDFEVYEDGVPQTIRGFQITAVETAQSSGESKKAVPAENAAPKAPRPETAAAAPARPNLIVLVIDNLNSQWANLARVEEGVETFISKTLQPNDYVAVSMVSHAGLLQNFTNNREALLAAVRSAIGRSTQATMAAGIIDQATSAAGTIDILIQDSAPPDAQDVSARLTAIQNDWACRSALSTVQSLCKSLAAWKGRKTLMFISEGFGVTSPVQKALAGVIDDANKANVSIYPINAKGLPNSATEFVQLFPPMQQQTIQSAGRAVAGNTSFDLIRLEAQANSYDDGLSALAESTGGVTFRNSQAFQEPLNKALADSHSYYLLSYIPQNGNFDGKFRKIEVRLSSDNKGYSVRARRGYYAVDSLARLRGTSEEQMAEGLYSPELIDEIHSSLFPAVFLDPTGESMVKLSVLVDSGGVPLEKRGEQYAASFKLLAAVFDESGRIVSHHEQDYRLSFDEVRYMEFLRSGSRLNLTLKLPAGKYQLKTVLREVSGGRMSTQRELLEVAPLSGDLPYISSIILSRSAVPADEAVEQPYDPFRLGKVLVVPSYAKEYSRDGFLNAFFHVCNVADQNAEPYQLRFTLYRDQALFSRSDSRRVQSENSHPLKGYLLTQKLALSGLEPGSYRLEVEVALPDGRNRVSRSVAFRVN